MTFLTDGARTVHVPDSLDAAFETLIGSKFDGALATAGWAGLDSFAVSDAVALGTAHRPDLVEIDRVATAFDLFAAGF